MYDLAEHQNLCPCSSDKLYSECCHPYHQGVQPSNALALMRSRFSAYSLGLKNYIIKTTHPASPLYQLDIEAWGEEILKFSNATTFVKLEILDFTESAPFSSVTFAAHLTKGRRRASFTEKSYFETLNGRWLYRNGITERGIALKLNGPSPKDLLPLAYFGDDILLQKASPVVAITDEIRTLAHQMLETMDALDGLGLAAPQVHKPLRFFVIREPLESEDDDEDFEPGEVKFFINPSLTNPSDQTWDEYEACLSIPGFEAKIQRPWEITVNYTDLEGNNKEERASGWFAKALMHEMDHLDGTLFYTHLPQDQQEKLKPFLIKFKTRVNDAKSV